MRLSKDELHARHPWTQHVIFNETIMPEDSKEEVERLVQRVKEVLKAPYTSSLRPHTLVA